LQQGKAVQQYVKKTYLENAFHVHPYQYFYKAEIDDILSLNTAAVEEYHHNVFIPENINIIVTGPQDSYRAIKQFQSLLNDFSRTPSKTYTWDEEPEQIAPRRIQRYHTFGNKFAFVTVGWRAPSIRNPDTFTMDLILALLGMGESSRLNKHIRNQDSDVYYIWAEYLTPRDPGSFVINAVCDPSAAEKIEQKILRECAILRKDLITPYEMDRAVQMMESQEAYQWESTESAAAYLGYWAVMKDFTFAKNYLKQIRSVSLNDIQRVADRYFGEETYTSVIMLPEKER